MWKIKKIFAYNFMSFDKVEYELDDRCYVIRGENQDNAGQASNGGGKTSFVDIIAVSFLGTSLTRRALKDCVNWSGEESFFEVGVEMVNGKQTAAIRRKVYSNTKSAELFILIDSKVPSTLPSKRGVEGAVDVRAGNQYILQEILDITSEDLFNYYFISKSYSPFLASNTDKKLEVISRFTNTKAVDKVIFKLGQDHQDLSNAISEYEDKITSCSGFIEGLLSTLNHEEFESKKQDKISAIDSQITLVENQIISLQLSIDSANEQIEKIELHDPENQRFEDLTQAIHAFDEEMGNVRLEIAENNQRISFLESYLAGVITCPNCLHKFNPKNGDNYTIQDLQESRKVGESLEVELNQLKSERMSFDNQIKDIEKIRRENENLERKIQSHKSLIEDLSKRQENYITDIEKLEYSKEIVAASTLEDETARIQEKINERKDEIKQYENKLILLNEEREKVSTWISNFEDFKFYLGNKPLSLICSLVNQYLSLNQSDLNLYIEGFKKLRSGEIRQALNPVIYRNWMNPQKYEQFSEGEIVRLNISVDLAFQQLINSASKTGGLGIYINDELLNPLDSLGVSNGAKAFDKLNKTILLVTHSGADLVYDNTIVVRKENRISTVL